MTPAVLACAAWLAAMPAIAAAQVPDTSFHKLPTRLRMGDKVYVTDATGHEIKGRVAELSPESLVPQSGGRLLDLPAASVISITWQEPDSLANGALIGLGVGLGIAGAGLASCAADSNCHTQGGGWVAFGVAVYGGIGTGIGVAIDALIPGRRIGVYRATTSPSAARFAVTPILTPKYRGVTVRVAF
jgi:hypothetical protein